MALGEWLEGDDPFSEIDAAKGSAPKSENAQAALIFAQKYLIFKSGVAKELLDFWIKQARYRKVAPGASPTEFAYYEGWRQFVEQINLQIEFAETGGQLQHKER